MESNHNEEYLPLKQMISSTPFDFSSSAFSMNPGTCCMLKQEKKQIKNIKSNVLRQKSEIKLNEKVYLHVGVKAPGTPKRMTFLPAARVWTEALWSWSFSSKKEIVPSGTTSPTAIGAMEVSKGFEQKKVMRKWNDSG